ncbi:MAG: hypothetical protein ABJF11_19910 [Reichenbachiella sp.]
MRYRVHLQYVVALIGWRYVLINHKKHRSEKKLHPHNEKMPQATVELLE